MVREAVNVMIVEIEEGRVTFSGGDAVQEVAACVKEEGNLPGVGPDICACGIPEKEPPPQGESGDQPADCP
jgi:hypothetical protein